MLQILTQSTWGERIGWVLVHSLWQFAVVALLAVVLQRALWRRSAAARYWALLAAMIVMVAVPAATWFSPWSGGASRSAARSLTAEMSDIILPSQDGGGGTARGAAATPSPVELAVNPQPEPQRLEPASGGFALSLSLVARHIRPWLPGIVACWFAGVLIAAFRPLLSWYTVRRLRTVGVSPVAGVMRAVLERTAKTLRVARAVEVLQSTLVKTPVVAGCFRPAILLPLSVVTGLPESQLELILAHELAHIRRHDYLVNLLQTLVETLFFYHPAVWWLSRQIRNEREDCCDDVAMATVGNRADYGRALLALEELRAKPTALSVAATGGSLLARIRRIAGCEPASGIGGGGILWVILTSIVIFAAVAWAAVPTAKGPTSPGVDASDYTLVLAGKVVDAEGKAVKGARVAFGYGRLSNIPDAKSDSEGFFLTLTESVPPTHVTVEARGYASLHRRIGEGRFLRLCLEKACVLRGRVVDPQGSPLAGVAVTTGFSMRDRLPQLHRITNYAGQFLWRNAPSGEIALSFSTNDGRWMIKDETVQASSEEQTITMSPAMSVRGTVVDERTGEPVNNFHFDWGSPRGRGGTIVYTSFDGCVKGNTFQVRNNQPHDRKECLRIEAEGYEPVTREFPHAPGLREFHIKLRKAVADPFAPPEAAPPKAKKPNAGLRTVRVRIVGPDGKPVAGTQVSGRAAVRGRQRDAFIDAGRSDADGNAVVELPQEATALHLDFRKPGYLSHLARWEEDRPTGRRPLPQDVTIHLIKPNPEQAQAVAEMRNLSSGNTIRVEQNEKGPRVVVELVGDRVTDAGLELLRRLPAPDELRVIACNVTDAGLAHLEGLRGLKELQLMSPEITDAGLTHLQPLEALEELTLVCSVTDAGMKHLTPLKRLRALIGRRVERDPATYKVFQAITQLTPIEFTDTTLQEVCKVLGDSCGIKVQFDEAAVKSGKASRPVTVNVRGVPLAKTLDLLLHPLRLDWTVRKGALLITTRDIAPRGTPGTTSLQQALPSLKQVDVHW